MQTVYKYLLKPYPLRGHAQVDLPYNSEILHVAFQGENLCLWALVDVNAPSTNPHDFLIIGTGHPIADSAYDYFHHLGTVFRGPYVFHVFETTGWKTTCFIKESE